MDSDTKGWIWFICLMIVCGVLFGGSPDLVDAIVAWVARQ